MSDIKGFLDTIDWYNKNAVNYAKTTTNHTQNVAIFTSYLSGKIILDAGCGAGHDTDMFDRLGYDTTGIDISTGLINEAKKRYPKSKFVIGDLLNIPFENSYFNGVWAQASLLHFETVGQVKQVINEFFRVLNDNGILYVFVKKQRGSQKTAVVSDTLSKHDRFFQYFNENEIKQYLRDNGFEILKTDIQNDLHGRNEIQWIMVIGKKSLRSV